ncbi:MAG TPA: hypothetical protein VEH84_15980 [Alphaproteobacteria bacterium]|nr:hypothetical protein [Alphaproteobacteria bacterium]
MYARLAAAALLSLVLAACAAAPPGRPAAEAPPAVQPTAAGPGDEPSAPPGPPPAEPPQVAALPPAAIPALPGEEAAFAAARQKLEAGDAKPMLAFIEKFHDGRQIALALALVRDEYSVVFDCEQAGARTQFVGYFSNPCRNAGGRTLGVRIKPR